MDMMVFIRIKLQNWLSCVETAVSIDVGSPPVNTSVGAKILYVYAKIICLIFCISVLFKLTPSSGSGGDAHCLLYSL